MLPVRRAQLISFMPGLARAQRCTGDPSGPAYARSLGMARTTPLAAGSSACGGGGGALLPSCRVAKDALSVAKRWLRVPEWTLSVPSRLVSVANRSFSVADRSVSVAKGSSTFAKRWFSLPTGSGGVPLGSVTIPNISLRTPHRPLRVTSPVGNVTGRAASATDRAGRDPVAAGLGTNRSALCGANAIEGAIGPNARVRRANALVSGALRRAALTNSRGHRPTTCAASPISCAW